MSEHFITILEEEKSEQLIPFLQGLTIEQKKELSPQIKKLSKEYFEYKEIKNGNISTYKKKATEKQSNILLFAAFVCLNRSEFEKSQSASWILREIFLDQLLYWYCPAWFSDFVNSQTFFQLDYNAILKIEKEGFIKTTKELIVRVLPGVIHKVYHKESFYTPEKLLEYSITLEEHIWYLFEMESSINSIGRYIPFSLKEAQEDIGWINVFKKYSSEGKISRHRLLVESLLASNRNFNKTLSGWFTELFIQLEPSPEELIAIQKELFSALSSSHSKPVNTSLQCFKKIVSDKGFDDSAFLDNVPVLLSSSTKSIVASTLMILEKLAKKNKNAQLQSCKLITQVFIFPDDELQTRAAKFITSYTSALDDSFKEELVPYYETMMVSAKGILKEAGILLAVKKDNNSVAASFTIPSTKEELIAIPIIENVDDLVFLASQAFDNNEPWHIDLLPAALTKFNQQKDIENFASRLEPPLQRALQITRIGLNSLQGRIDRMLAIFFIDFCIYLVRKYPVESELLRQLIKTYDRKEGETNTSFLAIKEDDSYIMNWGASSKEPFYLPHKQFLVTALEKIKNKDDLPLLSTPTYQPAWIDAETLVERMALYQERKQLPDNMDWQIAISRCMLKETGNAITLTEQKLSGEYRNLFLFLFGKQQPEAPFENTSVWMTASLSLSERKKYTAFEKLSYYRRPFEKYTGQFKWETVNEEYEINRYNFQLQKSVPEKEIRKIIRVHLLKDIESNETKGDTGIQKLINKLLPKVKEDLPLLYDYLTIKSTYFSDEHNDIRRILLLTPNNPERFLAEILQSSLQYPTFWNETSKKTVIATLQTLYEIWDEPGKMAHVFLATCMLASDKTVANIAGEIWTKAVSRNTLNNVWLGQAIGIHEKIEFAPLKRFTDLASQNLFRISTLHNQQLQILIENIIIELPDVPIKNLKKLLEIYTELLAANTAIAKDSAIIAKLKIWKNISGLQKVTDSLLDKMNY